MASPNRIDDILERLADDDLKVRRGALDDLEDLQQAEISPSEGIALLRAAAGAFPRDEEQWNDSSQRLVEAAAEHARREYTPEIVRLYGDYGNGARWAALHLLAALGDRDAARALLEILRSHAREGRVSGFPTTPLEKKPHCAEILFPELLDYVDIPELEFGVCLLCLEYAKADAISPDSLYPYASRLLGIYSKYKAVLLPAQRDSGIAWMWEDDYSQARSAASLVLDLLRYVRVPEVERELRDALRYEDPRLKFFALSSLLEHKTRVEARHIADVAASAEMRNWLYDRLNELGQIELFPKAFRTQKALAESEMVQWLAFPTELGRPPDGIELMKVVSGDAGTADGMLDYYVFRYRTHAPHWAAKDGWMAGVAGPYLRKDAPTTAGQGSTFSSFEAWDSKTPEEHIGNIEEILDEWRAYHLKRQE